MKSDPSNFQARANIVKAEGLVSEHPYSNDATQDERKAIVKNDSYFARQSNTADDRRRQICKAETSTHTGQSSQIPSYQRTHLGHHDPVPATEPLGFSVNAMEPVGTPTEIQSSLPALIPATVVASPPVVGDRANEGPVVDVVSSLVIVGGWLTSMKRRGFGNEKTQSRRSGSVTTFPTALAAELATTPHNHSIATPPEQTVPATSHDSYVTLRCIFDHVPDTDVKIMALAQLMHPKFDDLPSGQG